jgi:hypothetical protein
MRICGACGASVLAQQTVCAACGSDVLSAKEVPALPEQLFWVQVRAQFQCRRCRHSSPLNYPDVDGAFECVHCKLEQPASPAVWKDGLLFAHAVADLGSPGADAREPAIDRSRNYNFELEGLGTSRSGASLHIRMTSEDRGHYERHSLEMEATPGHPLCERCAEPLAVGTDVDGALSTTCPRCADRATFTLDRRLRQLHAELVGVCANELRADRAVVQLGKVNEREAVAVQCPQCGAALELTARDHFVKCGYCQTPSNVPAKLKRQLFPSSVLVERWWLLFRGVAPERFHALETLREEAEEAEEEREEEEQSQRERAERARLEALEAQKQRADARRLNVILGISAAVCLTAVGVIVPFLPKEPAEPEPGVAALPKAPPSPAAQPAAIVAAVAMPPPPAILLKDCSCQVKRSEASAAEQAVLSVRSIPQLAGSSNDFALVFAINVGGRELELLTSAQSAPPATLRGATLNLALGCSNDTIAIASGATASGWSASTGSLQWSKALPVRYGGGSVLGPALNVVCQRAPVLRDVMSLPRDLTAPPTPLRLRVSDGELL